MLGVQSNWLAGHVHAQPGWQIAHRRGCRVRLAGIDTPESRTTDAREKILGQEVKEYLKKALDGATDIVIRTEKVDSSEKYGRILGWLFVNKQTGSLNMELVNKGYAWSYDGGTKKKDFAELLRKRV